METRKELKRIGIKRYIEAQLQTIKIIQKISKRDTTYFPLMFRRKKEREEKTEKEKMEEWKK